MCRTDGSTVRRRLLLGCLAATVAGSGPSAHGHEAPGPGRDREAADAAAPAFGTVIDFELTDAGGNRVRAVDLRGRWLLIFFGYTSCPDLCPTTLSEIAGALAQLGPLAARVQPIFVSVDPQRDTPQALREYVENFDARILPLSGNAEQLARAAGSVGAVFYKVPGPTPDEYTFAHNAIVTLIGPEGGIVTRFSSDAVVDDLARALRRLIDPAGSLISRSDGNAAGSACAAAPRNSRQITSDLSFAHATAAATFQSLQIGMALFG